MPQDMPFLECVELARDYTNRGMDIYQKFTCAHCGSRQTMDAKNVFFEQGDCEACGKRTNIEAQGCGFLLHARPGEPIRHEHDYD